MVYLLLLAAVAAEVAGTSLLPATAGFSRLLPTAGCLLAYAVSIVLLAQVVRHLPVGVVYALWSALGTAAVAVIGAVLLGQRLTPLTIVGLALVIGGVVVLNLGGAH